MTNKNIDVTPYLGAVQLPQSYDQPLTFHHLLTHTDGFEARMIGIAARTEADLLPLADLLTLYMPTQLYPPGEYMTYGNFATNLAGHLAAEVTERPFEQLIADSIFAPLGMRSSTLEQRLSAEMQARWATGYEYVDGEQVADPFFPDASLAQSPGLSPTSADLRRFVGSYRPLQADVTTFGKSMYFFAQQVEITAKDGFLYLTTTGMGGEQSSPMGGFEGTSQWAAVAPLQFEWVDGKGQIAFAEDEGSAITRLYSGQGYHSAFGKLARYESQGFQIALVALAAALILSGVVQTLIVWPVSLGVNKLRGRAKDIVWTETAVWLWTAVVSGTLALFILRAVGVLYAIGSVANLPNFAWGISDEMVNALNATFLLRCWR